jgi:hypothetical protein
MLRDSHSCPRCHGNALYRTHRRGFDWLLSAFGLRPVRCYTCDKRFYMRWSQISSGAGAHAQQLQNDHPKPRTRLTAYPD